MNSDRIVTAPVAEWLDPAIYPPPRGTVIQLFTETGISTNGHWRAHGYLAWAPLLQQPEWLKRLMDERWRCK